MQHKYPAIYEKVFYDAKRQLQNSNHNIFNRRWNLLSCVGLIAIEVIKIHY